MPINKDLLDIQIAQIKLAKHTTRMLIRDCPPDVQEHILQVFDQQIRRLDKSLSENSNCEDTNVT